MFKFVHTVYYNSTENRRADFEYHSSEPTFNEQLIAQLQQEIKHQYPVVVVNAQAFLPPFWQRRLLQGMAENHAIDHISALSTQQHELSPICQGFNGTLAQLDQVTYLLQRPQYFLSSTFNPNCFVVRNISALSADVSKYAVNNLVVDVPPKDQQPIAAAAQPDIGDQRPLPAHPLAELQLQLDKVDPQTIKTGYPGLDDKAVVLHLVMDWGGGVHQWVNDFAQNHDDMHHLILSSQGEFFRQQQGERFQLHWHQTSGLVLNEFHLSKAIKATTAHHAQYQSMLDAVIKNWDIQRLIISSLIGHAMDCLNTGLPTLRILHDYFPHWPSLNAQLDEAVIGQNTINQALLSTQQEPFGEIKASELAAWQHNNNNLLQQDTITIIAPDESVKTNLLKLPDSSSYAKTRIIPHALAPLTAVKYQADSSAFKVLVLGRISPPKGQNLLHECIKKLSANHTIEFVLLGAGTNGQAFGGYPNVRVIADYKQAELSQLLTEVSPQLALLTSNTAETFSYTLSELLMSGIPVLSTPVGALKNRITAGVNGLLVNADAEQVSNKILDLQQHPEELQKLHQGALQTKHLTVEENKTAFNQLLKLSQVKLRSYQTEGLLMPKPMVQELQTTQRVAEKLKQALNDSEVSLAEKSTWAMQLTEHNQHLTKNIDLGRKQIEHLEAVIKSQSDAHHSETNHLKQEIGHISKHLEQVNEELTETIQVRDNLVQKYAEQSQFLHDTQLALSQSEDIIEQIKASRSWRVTKPLRAFTTYARHKRNAIKFRYAQLTSLPKRVINSLKSRGLKQTALMAKNKLNKPKPQAPATAQAVTEDYQPLTIQCSTKPLVSVVIPVFNQFKHTYHCLESLANLPDKTGFEVIVIDDCSTDETHLAIQQIDGIIYHRQAENGGFIESCNTGAKLAQGQFLLFLNNDTEVLPGWLDELVLTFEQQPDAGLVGSQLLYPDGRLQEAGGIVFNDASGWNYGRLDAPDAPEYQHLREATYISGASIMITQSLFKQLGCFDERYKPAYYEDTDLAFAVRKAGLKVFYQPHSRVIHFEGISSGTDLNSGTKKYQVINQQKFADKWQHELASQPTPGSDIELARLQSQPPRVLIFDACTPTPDQDSGSLRMMNLMKIFSELGYHVSFVPENMAHFNHYTKDLQRMGVECVYAPKYTSAMDYLKAKGSYFQTIILSRYYVAEPLMPSIRSYCPQAKIWFDTVDLHYLRETRMAELDKDTTALKAAAQTKRKELGVAKNCDLTLVVSPYEQQVLATENPDLDVAVLSNIHELYGGHQGFVNSQDIMFIGGYQHTPNVDGVLWFVDKILPLILADIPNMKLHIIGSKAPQKVIDLGQHPSIEFHGFVEDIEPLMQNIRIAVAPLRFGAGVKGKVNMSMSYGQPVVGTKVAVEGMYTRHGHDVMMADDAADFAAAVINLYQDQMLWEQVSKGGLENVEKWFSFKAAKNSISDLLGQF
jgi:GT2 family glycosyltransferase/glycosyltransferase involved in cell wall biosynthesis